MIATGLRRAGGFRPGGGRVSDPPGGPGGPGRGHGADDAGAGPFDGAAIAAGARERFSPERVAARLTELYAQVVKRE